MRLRGLESFSALIKQACIDKMPARRCTLYCFLFERRGLGPLAPHSPAFMSQDTPLHQRHLFLSLIFSLPLFFCGESHESEVVCCRCGRLPRWAGGMAAVLIGRLPGAPLWGVERWGDKRHGHTRPPLNTNTIPTVTHTEDHLCSTRHQALAFIYLHLLSLWLFSWSSKDCFHSIVSLNCWCRSAALIARRRRGDWDGGMTQRQEEWKMEFFGKRKVRPCPFIPP